jgi:Uma2 family endonuclease
MSEITAHLPSKVGEPAWEAAYFFPPQGYWSEETFLQIHSNRMAELVAGRLEILPMPTPLHQLIVIYFLDAIRKYLTQHQVGGMVLVAPTPTRLFPGTIREPDVLYISPAHLPEDLEEYPSKIDFAVEIVSEGVEARRRDYEDKRVDYAKAGISEYWIVDPQQSLISVLTLEGGQYSVSQECPPGGAAHSLLLKGFTIAVDEIWALKKSKPAQS